MIEFFLVCVLVCVWCRHHTKIPPTCVYYDAALLLLWIKTMMEIEHFSLLWRECVSQSTKYTIHYTILINMEFLDLSNTNLLEFQFFHTQKPQTEKKKAARSLRFFNNKIITSLFENISLLEHI